MKKRIIALVMMLFCITAMAQEQTVMVNSGQVSDVDDFAVVKDEVVDGIRYVTATPSAKVCSKQIDIEIKDNVILKVVYITASSACEFGQGEDPDFCPKPLQFPRFLEETDCQLLRFHLVIEYGQPPAPQFPSLYVKTAWQLQSHFGAGVGGGSYDKRT